MQAVNGVTRYRPARAVVVSGGNIPKHHIRSRCCELPDPCIDLRSHGELRVAVRDELGTYRADVRQDDLDAALQVKLADRLQVGLDGVRANAILPGPFSNTEEQSENSVSPNDPFLERLKARTVLGRVGNPRELVGALLYLVSDASTFTTGQALIVDGGWTIV